MASEKAWYWVAVVVLVAGLGHSFVSRHLGSLEGCWMERSAELGERVAERITASLDRAEMKLGLRSAECSRRPEIAVVRLQTRLASLQGKLARGEAGFARMEAPRVRCLQLQSLQMQLREIRPGQSFSGQSGQAFQFTVPQPRVVVTEDGTI